MKEKMIILVIWCKGQAEQINEGRSGQKLQAPVPLTHIDAPGLTWVAAGCQTQGNPEFKAHHKHRGLSEDCHIKSWMRTWNGRFMCGERKRKNQPCAAVRNGQVTTAALYGDWKKKKKKKIDVSNATD